MTVRSIIGLWGRHPAERPPTDDPPRPLLNSADDPLSRQSATTTSTPDQTKAAGQFSSEQAFQGADVLTWTDVVPRVGMNWDVTGDGETSFKTFFGIFGDMMGADFAATYNPYAEVTTRYRWRVLAQAEG